jgi:hypothetical protein
MREAVTRKIKEAGYTDKWGPWDSLSELVDTIWGQGHTYQAFFKLPKSPLIQDYGFYYDGVQSGELMTLSINNMTNRAVVEQFLDYIHTTNQFKNLNLQMVRFQGDDYIGLWKVSESSLEDERRGNGYNAQQHKRFVEERVSQCEKNGMSINPLKTTFRLSYGEYLKKTFIYGMHVGLRLVQLWSSERERGLTHPIDELRGYFATLRTIVSRGGVHDFHLKIAFATWAFRRTAKSIGPLGTRWIVFPNSMLYTPGSMGGMGELPFSLIGASKDALIALYCSKSPQWERDVDVCASVMKYERGRFRENLAESVANGEGLIGNKDVFTPGINFTRSLMPNERVLKAQDAIERLRMIGAAPPSSLNYLDQPENRIKDAVIANNQLVEIAKRERLYETIKALRKMQEQKITQSVRNVYAWVYAMNIEHKETPPMRKDINTVSPFPTLDHKLQRIIGYFGVDISVDAMRFRPTDVLTQLRKGDPDFPRQYSAEAVFKYLTNPVLLNDISIMIAAIQAIGGSTENAAKVAQTMVGSAGFFSMRSAGAAFSLEDTFIPNIDLGLDNHVKWVKIDAMADMTLEKIWRELLMLFIMSEIVRGALPTTLDVRPFEGSIVKTYSALKGHLFDANAFKYFELFPPRENTIM